MVPALPRRASPEYAVGALPTVEATEATSLTPVQYEQYAKEYMAVTGQDNFDGFRLEAAKAVTANLQSCHSLLLGTTLRDTGYIYQFGPTFALDDGRLFLMSRYASDGAMTARMIHKWKSTGETRISAGSDLQQERNMVEAAIDYAGSDWASSCKLMWQGTWILNGSFSQVVTPRLQMGGDLTYLVGNGASIGSAGLRYSLGSSVLSTQVARQPDFKSPTGLTRNVHTARLQYFRRISERLQLGTELEVSHEPRNVDSTMKIGFEYLFRQAQVQGLIDTSGKVSVTAQDASGFGVSGAIDYWRGDYKFGFMVQLMPAPVPDTSPMAKPPS